jgi:hypothetical protein
MVEIIGTKIPSAPLKDHLLFHFIKMLCKDIYTLSVDPPSTLFVFQVICTSIFSPFLHLLSQLLKN